MSWFMVDVETDGPCPGLYSMISLGCVLVKPGLTTSFKATMKPISEQWDPSALAVSGISRTDTFSYADPLQSMLDFNEAYEFALGVCNTAVELLKKHHTPGPEVECPAGLPFAVYTVEIEGGDVINVVEGQAWIDTSISEKTGRDFLEERPATEKEKRVTEILSQMLTERSLNPHAETRVPVREVDGKHAAQQRAAEERDVKAGTSKIRTIKFVATPPRHLREAAEVILHSHRRAHWVVGHWRNQAFGEGHMKRKQTWIHPHIRGLGEAGSTAAKVVAPRKEIP